MMSPSTADETRCCFVALIGAPNAGKSTLVNQMVGTKVSIVTHKVQTTRNRVRGIVVDGNCQLILVDTPGIFAPRRRLDRAMVDAAWSGAEDADIVAVLIDAAKGVDDDGSRILERVATLKRPKILILNKIDRVKKEQLLGLVQECGEITQFDATFMVSALKGSGVRDLGKYLKTQAPVGPWHYPGDDVSDAPMRLLAAEITREKLFLRLHQELPYASTVETSVWKTLRRGAIRIEQTIYVERDSQKRIVLGKGGQTIKAISMEARNELKEILETEVQLFLFVKVRENWTDDPERYHELGLEFPKR